MRLKDMEGVTARDHFMIDPSKIRLDRDYNIRDLHTPEAVAGIEELALSIQESGLRVPLLVRKDDDREEIVLVQGHRRWTAIMLLRKRGVPFAAVECLAESKKRSPEDRTLDLFLSNDGVPLTEMEKAEAIARLLSYGWKEAQIALKLGKSASYVSHLKALKEMPERVQEQVRQGEVAAATALKLVREEGPEQAATIIEEAAAEISEAKHGESPSRSSGVLPLSVGESGGNGSPPASETPQPAKKVTAKAIERVREKREGKKGETMRTAKPRDPNKQNMSTLYDALFVRIQKYLTAIRDGSYDDDLDGKLEADAKELSEIIEMTRQGFRDMAQDAEEAAE